MYVVHFECVTLIVEINYLVNTYLLKRPDVGEELCTLKQRTSFQHQYQCITE